MATWKKVIVSGSNISQLNNDSNYLTSTGQNIVSSSAQTIANLPAGTVSGSAQTIANLPSGTVSGSSQVDGASISSNTVGFGGVSVALGSTDATPAFDLTDATAYPGDSSLVTVGTVTSGDVSAILPAGSVSGSSQIDGASISSNTVGFGGVSVALGSTDATPAFDLTDATAYPGDSSLVTVGTVTSGDVSAILPAGSVSGSSQIDGASISSNTVGFGGVSVALGSTDATPAFDLTDATAYPGDSSLTTVGTVTSGDVSAILPSGVVSGSVSTPSQGTLSVNGNNIDLGLQSGDSPTFAGLTISGDLTVNGNTTTINTSNLEVEDRFIFLNEGSGSATPVGEGGIIVEGGTAGEGEALYREQASNRWAVAGGVAKNATSATADGFLSIVLAGAASTDSAIDALVDNEYEAKGNIFIGDDQGIWIYS